MQGAAAAMAPRARLEYSRLRGQLQILERSYAEVVEHFGGESVAMPEQGGLLEALRSGLDQVAEEITRLLGDVP